MSQNNVIHVINFTPRRWAFGEPEPERLYVVSDYVDADYVE